MKKLLKVLIVIALLGICVSCASLKDKPESEYYVIEISSLPTCGTFTRGGYGENEKVLNFKSGGTNNNVAHSLGVLDLRKYDSITIYYGTSSASIDIGSFSIKTTEGQYLASAPCKIASDWKDTQTSVTIDISSLRNNEEIILELTDYINGAVVYKIELHKTGFIGEYPDMESDEVYICGNGSDLNSYFEKSFEDYSEVCNFYKDKGYSIYGQNEKNGNHFTTFVKNSEMVHVYWIACESELNIIFSTTNGAVLPPQKPAVTQGEYETTVTQIRGDGNDVSGYIIQLSDGSFVIYDGGNAACATEINDILKSLSGDKSILIRAWVLTVDEVNNHGAFSAFASAFAQEVTLETVLTAPVGGNVAEAVSKNYFKQGLEEDVSKFNGAKICYVHTGMDLYFCNVKIEILFTPEEQYICDPPRVEDGATTLEAEFRNTSLVSRIVTEKGSMLMLSNSGLHIARRMVIYYRDYLRSDICQMAENGLGDLSMYIYNVINAPVLFCPATADTFENNTTNQTVRKTLAESPVTERIILLDSEENKIVLDDIIPNEAGKGETFDGILDPGTLEVNYEYKTFDGGIMKYYFGITAAEVKGIMAFYLDNGYDKYSDLEANGNLAATYTKGEEMVHIYWYEIEKRLTIVTVANGGATLPVKPVNVTGPYETTITQIKSDQINGMGYVIRLADGSFIIYDGGYRDTTDTKILGELWDTLNDQTPKGKEIIIRAWVLTHPHGDHYGTFINFCNTYAEDVKLERVLVTQITEEVRALQKNDGYIQYSLPADVAKFEGAVLCNVYPGMVFEFCNVKMEILGTYHDAYILAAPKGTNNNVCVVSRIVCENDSVLFLADAGIDQTEPMAAYFGNYLNSSMCQISHHGVEDCPLIFYRHVKARTLWYPCDTALYNLTNRDEDVRKALAESKYTKEIYLHDITRKTKELK